MVGEHRVGCRGHTSSLEDRPANNGASAAAVMARWAVPRTSSTAVEGQCTTEPMRGIIAIAIITTINSCAQGGGGRRAAFLLMGKPTHLLVLVQLEADMRRD